MAERTKGYQVRARLLAMAKDQPGDNGEAIRIALADLDAAAAVVAAARAVIKAAGKPGKNIFGRPAEHSVAPEPIAKLRRALTALDATKE